MTNDVYDGTVGKTIYGLSIISEAICRHEAGMTGLSIWLAIRLPFWILFSKHERLCCKMMPKLDYQNLIKNIRTSFEKKSYFERANRSEMLNKCTFVEFKKINLVRHSTKPTYSKYGLKVGTPCG